MVALVLLTDGFVHLAIDLMLAAVVVADLLVILRRIRIIRRSRS